MERPPKPTGASSGYPLTSLRLRTTVIIISGEPYNMDLYFGMGQLENKRLSWELSMSIFPSSISSFNCSFYNTSRIKFVTNGKGPWQKVHIFNTFFVPLCWSNTSWGETQFAVILSVKACVTKTVWNFGIEKKKQVWEIYLQDAGRLHFQLRCIQMLQKGIYCLQTAEEMETGPSPSPSYAFHAHRRFCTTRPSYLWSNMEMQNFFWNLGEFRQQILSWFAQFGQALNFPPASGYCHKYFRSFDSFCLFWAVAQWF